MACSTHRSTTRCVEPSYRRQCFPTRINDAGRTMRRTGWRSQFIDAIGTGVAVTREVAILPPLSPRQRGQLAALVATDLGVRLPQTPLFTRRLLSSLWTMGARRPDTQEQSSSARILFGNADQ